MTTKVTNVYNLKLTPSQFGQSSLVVNCSQYDSLFRVIQFNLFNGNAVYSIPEGSVVTIRGTKKDNTGFEYECDYSNNVVTFPLQQQITIFPGKVPAELRITNNGEIIGSWNFLFLVEESPLSDNTTISETQLPLLEQAIEAAGRLNEAFDDITEFTDETYPNAVQAIQNEGATQVANVTNEGTTQRGLVTSEGTTQIANIQAEGATQVGNVQAKGTEVLDSIPSDYTELSEEVADLKTALGDITKNVTSKNIYDQDSAVIVTGKFLNPNNGAVNSNTDYYYNENYIPVEADTAYCASTWSKSTYAFGGNYRGFMLFYDSDKSFISGSQGDLFNPFTTPSNCAYIRISADTNSFNSNYIMIEKGESRSAEFEKYLNETYIKLPFYTVDQSGNGDYTSLSEAVSALPSGSTILVNSGTYVEQVSAWGKEIHIIGIDRESCILKDTSGNYSTPPLEIGAGSVQNMTIIEQANGAGSENMAAYAIHVEDNNLYDKNLLIRNCYIESDSSSAIGMGLRGGCNVRIEDCEIICSGARISTGAAPLYFHDADSQAFWGTANLYLKNNVLRNTSSTLYSMLTVNSIHAENTTYLHFMFNILVRKNTAQSIKFNTWNTSGNTDADGWNGLSHMYLTDDSFGNNLSELNYSA